MNFLEVFWSYFREKTFLFFITHIENVQILEKCIGLNVIIFSKNLRLEWDQSLMAGDSGFIPHRRRRLRIPPDG